MKLGTWMVVWVTGLGAASNAQPVQWPAASGGNGHYYERVSGPALTWHEARDAAAARTHAGMAGHLATFTSAAEWSFITSGAFLPEPSGAWIGADQAPLGAEPIGGWRWVTGETFGFTRWLSGSPDNAGNEDAMAIGGAAEYGWIDTAADNTRTSYVVEYEPFRPEEGLIAHYTFDGHANDVGGHGHAGTIEGGVGFVYDSVRQGTVANFDGSTGLIKVHHGGALSFDLDTESYTIMLWVRAAWPSTNTTFLQDRWGSNGAFSSNFTISVARDVPPPPGFSTNSYYGEEVNPAQSIEAVSAPQAYENRWVHLATTFDHTTGFKTLFVNGQAAATGVRPAVAFSPASSATITTIGGAWYPSNEIHHLAGRLDDLRFYNRALSPDEIATIGSPPPCDLDIDDDGIVDQNDVDALINMIAGGGC